MQKKFLRTLFATGLFFLVTTIPQPSHSMDDEEGARLHAIVKSCTNCYGKGSKQPEWATQYMEYYPCQECTQKMSEQEYKDWRAYKATKHIKMRMKLIELETKLAELKNN